MQRKTVSIQENIPLEIYYGLLEFGNGELVDGIQRAMHLAYVMENMQKSQTSEEIIIWSQILQKGVVHT